MVVQQLEEGINLLKLLKKKEKENTNKKKMNGIYTLLFSFHYQILLRTIINYTTNNQIFFFLYMKLQ
jgi:hypothetical protein